MEVELHAFFRAENICTYQHKTRLMDKTIDSANSLLFIGLGPTG